MKISRYEFLSKKIFFDILDVNDGCDEPFTAFFSEKEFSIVLDRIEQYGCGIYGIETFLNGQYFDTEVVETNGGDPLNPSWYREAFNSFRTYRTGLTYSATYYVPEALLSNDRT